MKGTSFFYGYVIVAAVLGIMSTAWGVNRTFGVFFDPLLHDFGWPRAGISGVYTTCMLISGAGSVLLGRLTDRLGPRIPTIACGIAMGGGYFLCSRITELWHFYAAFGVLTGIGMSGAWAPLMSVVVRWFYRRRSFITGILTAGSASGVVLMPIGAAFLIEWIGWRETFLVLAVLTFSVMFAAGLFLKRDPSQIGAAPDGQAITTGSPGALQTQGMTMGQAVKTSAFWLMAAICFSDFFLINVVAIHVIPHAILLGIDPIRAATILSLSGAVSIPGRIGVGALADRFGNRTGMIVCLSLSVAAFALLPFAGEIAAFWMFAVLYGFGLWAASAIVSPFIADLFGLKSHGTIYSCIFFCSSLGGGLGPVAVGGLFDRTGDYRIGFWLCLAMSAMALAAFIRVRVPQVRTGS